MQEFPVSLFAGDQDDSTEDTDSDSEKGIVIEEPARDMKLFKVEVVQ